MQQPSPSVKPTVVFQRKEQKYKMTPSVFEAFFARLSPHVRDDPYGPSVIRSLYLDTEHFELIRRSLERPAYKEKIRLRAYGDIDPAGPVFLELKKKVHKVTYKRRVKLTAEQAQTYIDTGQLPDPDTQIMREIDWSIRHYETIAPRLLVAYDREAYYDVSQSQIRISFDRHVRYRSDQLSLSLTGAEQEIDPELIIMELKLPGAMPLWLADLLDEYQLYPTSFSKYGTCYQRVLQERREAATRSLSPQRSI